MKKLLSIILSLLMIFSLSALASCGEGDDPVVPGGPGDGPLPPAEYTVTFDSLGGSAVESVKVEENKTLSEPTAPTRSGHTFGGWFKDSLLTEPFGFGTDKITSDITLYAKWTENAPEYEDVSFEINISDLAAGTSDTDIISGVFTVKAGSEIRNRNKTFTNPSDPTDTKSFSRSIKFGSDSAALTVSVPGEGKLVIYVQNGSSGKEYQKVLITSPDGTSDEIEFVGTVESSPVVRIEIDVTEGEWRIGRTSGGGTVDLFMATLECRVEVSPESGFEIVGLGRTDYLPGESLDTSRLAINAIFENGKAEPVSLGDCTVDSSAVDFSTPGKYTVSVKYKDYTQKTYEVTVYNPTQMVIGFDAIEKLPENSSAGNGVYYNHIFKEVYAVGEEFSTKGLSVRILGVFGDSSCYFYREDEVSYSGFDSTTPGTKIVTVTYREGENTISDELSVSVVDTAPSQVNGVYQAKVDLNYGGAIGAVVDGYNCFLTVQEALDYFMSRSEIMPSDKKLIVVACGIYREKLEITIPNLTVRGAGVGQTVIEWNSLYGLKDESGFEHVTDSTATVAVRDTASGVTFEDITISNYFNSKEVFDRELGENYGEHRALALLVQADCFIMKNSALLGYQDTVELFTGRQYFKNVYIQGLTDFIFGTNNTTLFEGCTIHSITSGKTDGGYITAFKGMNKNSNDAITYGAIFYKCSFTADEDVIRNANTAIGRPWGAYASVAVIECELSGHISTKGSSGASKNERYVTMNAKPTDSTVSFVEYNNTGVGAITEAVAGMRFLSAEEAALYTDIAVIFGKNNGKLTYLDAWNPNSDEVKVDDRTYYYFDQTVGTSGTSYTFDIETPSFRGGTFTLGGIVINAENANVAWNSNANALNMKQGAYITFTVPAGSELTVSAFSGYAYFTVNGVGTSASTLSLYYEEQTEITLLSVGDLYLYSIIINPDEQAPEAPTLTEIRADGMNVNYVTGEALSLEGLTVRAYYSDNSVITLAEGEYTVDAGDVEAETSGEYTVYIRFGGKTADITVIFEESDYDPAITEKTVLSFTSEAEYNKVVNNKRVTLDGNFRLNGGEYQVLGTVSFMVKAGTKVTVTPYANPQYASYTLGKAGASGLETHSTEYTFTADEDCTVVYTGLSNNYLVSITVEPPTVGSAIGNLCPEYAVELFGENGKTGEVFDPSKNKGKITVINFWFATCPGCLSELPYFDKLATEYKDFVTVLAVHADFIYEQAKKYIGDNYKDSDIIFGMDKFNSETQTDTFIAMLGGTVYYPVTVILDENGIIIASMEAVISSYQELVSYITPYL